MAENGHSLHLFRLRVCRATSKLQLLKLTSQDLKLQGLYFSYGNTDLRMVWAASGVPLWAQKSIFRIAESLSNYHGAGSWSDGCPRLTYEHSFEAVSQILILFGVSTSNQPAAGANFFT
ncbi:hypothetical protein GOP47_0017188 [Adiantum capillus-veneris]|uniref:Uncharacterized protein n=1 Tax=Adiantum capillus-veneris TaxID=13818 RepID=A0A9D4ZB08_ADICA|nr:hypothetical protein GOP47_0017188 [Adiantum capillus-veneris]